MKGKKKLFLCGMIVMSLFLSEAAEANPQYLTLAESIKLAIRHSPAIKNAEAECETLLVVPALYSLIHDWQARRVKKRRIAEL